MAEPTPFERVFSPDQGGYPLANIFRSIGQAAGVPTQDERHGAAISNALQEFSKLQSEKNLSPQQAFVELMRTPAGMEVFKLPDGIAKMKDAILAQTPFQVPAPTVLGQGQMAVDRSGKVIGNNPAAPTTLSAGQGLYDSRGNRLAAQPSDTMQNFNALQEVAQLPPDQLRELARIQMLPAEDRKLATLRQWEEKGWIKPGMAIKLANPGLIKIHPLKGTDNFGKEYETGEVVVVDATDPNNPTAIKVGAARPGSVTTSTTTPTAENPAGIGDPGKTSMFFATGVVPQSLAWLDDLSRQTFGTNIGSDEGAVIRERTRQLEQLSNSIIMFPTTVGKTNVVVNSMKAMLPSFYKSPLDSVDAGIKIRQMVEQEIAANEQIIVDRSGTVAKEAKVEASKELSGYRQILRNLPPLSDMMYLKEQLAKGQVQTMTVKQGAQAVVDMGSKAVTAAKEQTTGKPADAVPETDVPLPRPNPNMNPMQMQQQSNVDNIASMTLMQLKNLDASKLTSQQQEQVRVRLGVLRKQLQLKQQKQQ